MGTIGITERITLESCPQYRSPTPRYARRRPTDGREKRFSLGVYLDISLKETRERRDEPPKLLTKQIDPSENRKAAKAVKVKRAANSFEVVARERYAKHSPNWSVNHGERIIRRLDRDIFP